MQKLCCVRTRQHPLPVWSHKFVISSPTHISTNSRPFLVGIVSINDLRIVETLDEFQSTTYGHGSSTALSYDTYYDLLVNACVRYDKTKKANIGKRRNVYTSNIDETYIDHPTACIDHVPNSRYGGIDLPPDDLWSHPLIPRSTFMETPMIS